MKKQKALMLAYPAEEIPAAVIDSTRSAALAI